METGKLTACLSLLCYSLASWFRHSSHDRTDSHVTCVRYLKRKKIYIYKYIRRWPFLHWRHALVRLLLFHMFSFSSPSVQVSTARLWDMSKPLFLALFGLCFGLLSAFPTQEESGGNNWVVLVAGSNGWYNYRHQVRHPGATGLHQRVPATWRLGTCSPAIGHLTPLPRRPLSRLPSWWDTEQQSQFVPSLFPPVSQADVCHAYQIVHKNGIPDEHIVVMMYDDLATNEEWVQFHFPHTTLPHTLITLFSSHLKSYLSASSCHMSGDANLLAD